MEKMRVTAHVRLAVLISTRVPGRTRRYTSGCRTGLNVEVTGVWSRAAPPALVPNWTLREPHITETYKRGMESAKI